MLEPDVTLTDYALTMLCAIFAWKMRTASRAWTLLFASVSIGALTGGTVHGFFPEPGSPLHRALWLATLLSIGVTTAAAWVITGLLISGRRGARPWAVFGAVDFTLYALVVIFYSQSFQVVIFNYMPAMVALFAATVYRRERWIGVGLAVSFLAAYVQLAQIAVHPVYFNHNSTYHLIQAFGLAAMFAGARRWSDEGRL